MTPTSISIILRAPVVQKLGSTIYWINLHSVDNTIGFPNSYPLDSAIQLLYNWGQMITQPHSRIVKYIMVIEPSGVQFGLKKIKNKKNKIKNLVWNHMRDFKIEFDLKLQVWFQTEIAQREVQLSLNYSHFEITEFILIQMWFRAKHSVIRG